MLPRAIKLRGFLTCNLAPLRLPFPLCSRCSHLSYERAPVQVSSAPLSGSTGLLPGGRHDVFPADEPPERSRARKMKEPERFGARM